MSSDGHLKSIQDHVSECLVETTRAAGQIANEDLVFQRSSNPSVIRQLDGQNARLLRLARCLIQSAISGAEVSLPELPDADSVEDNWRGIVDVVDNLLERADACLDEYTGVIRRLETSYGEVHTQIPFPRKTKHTSSFRNQDLPKPQLLFRRTPNNNNSAVFRPLLRSKPHSIKSLEDSISPTLSENGSKQYKHPYETEIIGSHYPSSTFVKMNPIPFLPFNSTTATFVDTPEAVEAMLLELKAATEIAVDLEHHDTHSYVGIVSLMQISTRNKDWVVDTLKPWREDLHKLNEVFANPNILKVFHGAFMDMIWLQRDLGLYVVGLFDTYHASVALRYSRHSLASLLAKFANFDAQKKYQMADWRIRPIPEEMFDYARSDTHFLLFIYDNMRNELIDKSDYFQANGKLIDVVLEESKKEALQRYESPSYDAEHGTGTNGWYNMLYRTPALLNNQQFAVFKAVHQWRDELARTEDEGVHFIMSKAVLFNISTQLPSDMAGLLGCCHPISVAVRTHAQELLDVVQQAKTAGVDGPNMVDFMRVQPRNLDSSSLKNGPGKVQTDLDVRKLQDLKQTSHDMNLSSMRSFQSRFWGLSVGDSRASLATNQPGKPQITMHLALPLPHLTAEVFVGATSKEINAGTSLGDPGALAEHRYVKDRKPAENTVFIVKELGGNRKRKIEEAFNTKNGDSVAPSARNSEPTGSDDVEMELSLNEIGAEQTALEKAQRKAARKTRKETEKRQRKVNGDSIESHGEEEAFDYTKAPSVLHAKPERNRSKGSKPTFDPYSKSLNAPKGMRKSKKEIEGRSITFKS